MRRSGQQRPVVVIDPGHDLRANSQTEPIGPGSSTRKIKDGGGTHGVVSGLAGGRAQPAGRAAAAHAARAGGRRGRHDADDDGRHEHGQRRARADREPCRRRALPPHPRRRLDRSARRAARTRSTRRFGRAGRTTSTPRAGAPRGSSSATLRRALGFPDRGLQERSDFTGFNWADVPVILVEMGFMTNPTEDRLLATAAYQRRAALGLCRGTLRYLGRSPDACGWPSAPVDRDDLDGLLDALEASRCAAPRVGRRPRRRRASRS